MEDNNTDQSINLEKIGRASGGVFGFFIERRKIVILITAIISIWGLFSLLTLPREANPEVKIPIALISTVWPGASPEDVEDKITDEIESNIKNISDIKELSSTSSGGLSLVRVEFEAEANLEKSMRELRDAVGEVVDLPDGITNPPKVTEISINDDAIVSFSFVGDLDETDLNKLAELVQDEIESIPGVSEAQIIGKRDREWRIDINPARLKQLNITGTDVARAIMQSNITLPVGDISIDNKIYDVRAKGEIETLEDLKKVAIPGIAGGDVSLSDISEIKDEPVERDTISRIAKAGKTPNDTMSIRVFKQTGGNIINIVDSARSKIEKLKESGAIPESVDIVATNDMSQFVRKDFNTLTKSGAQTMILIFVSLALVLAFRMALIAVISIPVIFLMSFGIISAQGSTLNSLTLFSLVLSLGLLIDTTIILLEGIHEGVEKGYSRKEAAMLSVETYKWPIIAGILTTIAAFIPMLLVEGIVGEFLKTLPLTIGATLGSSLIVGLFIMPALSTYLIKKNESDKRDKNVFQKKIHSFMITVYRPAILGLVVNRRKRRLLTWSIMALVAFSVAMLGFGVIKTELFPKSDTDFVFVNIELEQGSELKDTERITRQVESIVAQTEGLDNYLTTIGQSVVFGIGMFGSSSENLASITMTLKDESERRLKSYEISDGLRGRLKNIKGAKITVEDIENGPPSTDPIGIQVRGPNLAVLSEIAGVIKQKLSQIEGVKDITSSDKPSPPQVVFDLDRELLGKFGLNASQVSNELRLALFGLDIDTVSVNGEDTDIVVRYDEKSVVGIDDIKNIEVVNFSGERIKVSRVADVRIEPALKEINHRDSERAVFISARNEKRSVSEIQSEIDKKMKDIKLPKDYKIIQVGEFEDQNTAFYDLYKAMSVAVLLIFAIMVLQFDSFVQPFVILITLPLAFVGVILGIFIFGMPFGFPTFLGIVALSGIVVNDAIVLIDRINFNIRTRKMHIDDAVIEAGEARLQPIILTTVTTALGVIPLAFADEFWRGLSIAIAIGIVFATTLTLFVIPILYRKLEYRAFLKNHAKNPTELNLKSE